jgi:hypothetical protein
MLDFEDVDDEDVNEKGVLCHWCNKKLGIYFSPDPCEVELYPEEEESWIDEWWCDSCYQDRIWEI